MNALAEQQLPEDLFLDLDRASPVPLYHQVATRLEQAIRDERIPAGARLENEIALGQRLGLSRPTIRRAIQTLVDKGLLVRRRGIGTQVVHGRIARDVELTSLYEDLQQTGQHPHTRVLSFAHETADDPIAATLGLTPGDPVLHIRRLRFTEDVPLAVLDNVLPAEFAGISTEELESRGLYQLLRARGVTMRVAKQRIGARAAVSAEAESLDIRRGAPVLTMERTAFDANGRAVEFGKHCYRPDLYSFELTLVDR